MSRPLVSVVTPFFNTAAYLAECIESVLAQTYADFEYILLDNCSSDGSSEIAADYARSDRRIRLIPGREFLPQLPNYNRALEEISADSQYCKIVQADDWIFPQCLELMVKAFEQSEAIGLVSSHWLYGENLCGPGLAYRTVILTGRQCVQRYLRTGEAFFGTPTQVMYRSSLVRARAAFFNAASPFFADLQTCIELLQHSDFGFVHQVLSFSRNDNESIYRSVEVSKPYALLRYGMALRYGHVFLEAHEAESLVARRKREYYRELARASLLFPGRQFWRFHRLAMKTEAGQEKHDWAYFALTLVLEVLRLAANPGATATRALRSLKETKRPKMIRSGVD